jgi:hypothetical protein
VPCESGGAWANYLEVGAEDTATLNATINTVASSLAIVVPYLGFWLRRVTGSWFAQIMCSVVIKAISGEISLPWYMRQARARVCARVRVCVRVCVSWVDPHALTDEYGAALLLPRNRQG